MPLLGHLLVGCLVSVAVLLLLRCVTCRFVWIELLGIGADDFVKHWMTGWEEKSDLHIFSAIVVSFLNLSDACERMLHSEARSL